jgi:hypothetical protein
VGLTSAAPAPRRRAAAIDDVDIAFRAQPLDRLDFSGLVADGGDEGHLVAATQSDQLGVEQDRDRSRPIHLGRHRGDQ